MYRIIFTKPAEKALKKLPQPVARLIREKLLLLAEDPYSPQNNVTKMQNREGYRLRVGDWRVIYDLIDDELVVLVLKVGPRGSIYR
jgi:mRNA interferase RelE/StbE